MLSNLLAHHYQPRNRLSGKAKALQVQELQAVMMHNNGG